MHYVHYEAKCGTICHIQKILINAIQVLIHLQNRIPCNYNYIINISLAFIEYIGKIPIYLEYVYYQINISGNYLYIQILHI